MDRSGGWAWIALDATEGIERDSGYYPDTTNNQMELQGPIEGLNALFDKYGACEVLVYSDAQYVVLGAMNPNRARWKNRSFWAALDTARGAHTTVEFIHIKGHNGHTWNELADDMAGKARRKGVANGKGHRATARS